MALLVSADYDAEAPPSHRLRADEYTVILHGWTEERFWAEAPENAFWEFKDGEVIVASPVSLVHQDAVGFLYFLLRAFVERRGGILSMGPGAVRLREGLVREPDLFYLAPEHRDRFTDARIEGAADFVIEVISPGRRRYDLGEKAQDYFDHGVAEYWAVDPRRRELIAHRRVAEQPDRYAVTTATRGRVDARVPAGFWVDAAWLWERPMPDSLACMATMLGPGG